MGHMSKETIEGTYYAIETEEGTTFLPSDVCGILRECVTGTIYGEPDFDVDSAINQEEWDAKVKHLQANGHPDVSECESILSETYTLADDSDIDDAELWSEWCAQVRDYVGGNKIREIEERTGTLYRLSAPGYLDCTDWTPDADSPEFEDDDSI